MMNSSELLGIGDASLLYMPTFSDDRGNLTVGEMQGEFPFIPARYFIVFDVPFGTLRGEHAHKECQQFLLCVKGSCKALLDDGQDRKEVVLDCPNVGLYMPPMIWGSQYQYTADCALLVLASHPFQSSDYINNYNDFLQEIKRRKV